MQLKRDRKRHEAERRAGDERKTRDLRRRPRLTATLEPHEMREDECQQRGFDHRQRTDHRSIATGVDAGSSLEEEHGAGDDCREMRRTRGARTPAQQERISNKSQIEWRRERELRRPHRRRVVRAHPHEAGRCCRQYSQHGDALESSEIEGREA